MHPIEKERVKDVNERLKLKLDLEAFEAAWVAYMREPTDLCDDSDDEMCGALGRAILAYLCAAKPR